MGAWAVGLTVRLTRAQLVTLGARAAGLVLFDQLAPNGTFVARDESAFQVAQAKLSPDFRDWLGSIAATGSGSGSGSGSGYGYGGDGSGYGYGDGYGSVDGYGHGYGSGSYGYGYRSKSVV